MPPPQLPRVEELEFWSTGEKTRMKHSTQPDTVTISIELYERLLRATKDTAPPPAPAAEPKKYANAGPFGLFGLFITAMAFSCVELGMGGAQQLSGLLGTLLWTGPVPLLFAAFSDWLSGNFFAFVVYGAMGVFWLSFYSLVSPEVGVPQSYSPTGNYTEGLLSPAFNADIALYLVVWGLAVFVILVCSIRTNITFIILFTVLDAGLFIFAASHFQAGFENLGIALTLQKIGAGCTFVVSLLLFYLLCMTMFDEMQVGIHLPIGSLAPPADVQMKESPPHVDSKPMMHHHDEENQYGRVSLPLPR